MQNVRRASVSTCGVTRLTTSTSGHRLSTRSTNSPQGKAGSAATYTTFSARVLMMSCSWGTTVGNGASGSAFSCTRCPLMATATISLPSPHRLGEVARSIIDARRRRLIEAACRPVDEHDTARGQDHSRHKTLNRHRIDTGTVPEVPSRFAPGRAVNGLEWRYRKLARCPGPFPGNVRPRLMIQPPLMQRQFLASRRRAIVFQTDPGGGVLDHGASQSDGKAVDRFYFRSACRLASNFVCRYWRARSSAVSPSLLRAPGFAPDRKSRSIIVPSPKSMEAA